MMFCVVSSDLQKSKRPGKPPLREIPKVDGRNAPWPDSLMTIKTQTSHVKPAFLTFLVYRYYESLPEETSFSEATTAFMRKMNLKIGSSYWNPWMPKAYQNLDSCQKTIAHFRECRRYGCWNGRNTKWNCDDHSCKYHPQNPTEMKNKCDLKKGSYGAGRRRNVTQSMNLDKTIWQSLRGNCLETDPFHSACSLPSFIREKNLIACWLRSFKMS